MNELDPWERVRVLFAAALDQPAEGRAAFLLAACNGDEQLRREVTSLLAADAAAGGFLEVPALRLGGSGLDEAVPALKAGCRIGSFDVIAPLGAGGMGQVYRARDAELGREVALKVLPPAFASDEERLSRFQRESRILASLNHPNIASIHSIEHVDGLHLLVLELIEGPTLADRVRSGQTTVGESLGTASQLASALEAAHERGIVHRDLKPANVKVSASGVVKLLDFGLAKERVPEDPVAGSADGGPPTVEGAILGTYAYMSPEQVRGQPIDRRADVWAFGCILFELLAGRRAFGGETPSDTIAAVLDRPPDWTLLPAATPRSIRLLLRRCLEKDLHRRLHDIADARIEIDEARQPVPDLPARESERVAGVAQRHRTWRVAGVALAVLIAAAALRGFLQTPSVAQPSFHPVTFRRGDVRAARFSPDGRSIVYAFSGGGTSDDIYSAGTRGGVFRALGLADTQLFAVSRSGELAVGLNWRWFNTYSGVGTLARLPVDGGGARRLAENVGLADWSPDGRDLAIARFVRGPTRLEFPIGAPLFTAEPGGGILELRVSPRGDAVAIVAFDVNGVHSVLIVDRAGSKRVLSTGWRRVQGLAWTADGSEVWFAAAESSSAEVDGVYAVTAAGKPRLVARFPGSLAIEDIASDGRVLITQATVRREIVGRLAGDRADRDLTWFDYSFPADLSSDGRSLLFYETGVASGLRPSLWLTTADTPLPVRLGEGDVGSSLSPDGRWVAAKQIASDGWNTLKLVPTGTGPERPIDLHGVNPLITTWLQDSRRLVIAGSERGHKVRTYVVDVQGGAARPVAPEGVTPSLVGPDGRSVLGVRDGLPLLYPIGPGEPRAFATPANEAALREAFRMLNPIGWADKDHTVFVSQPGVPGRILRLDLETARTTPWRDVVPSDVAGVRVVEPMRLVNNGTAYVSSFRRVLSELYLVEGLK